MVIRSRSGYDATVNYLHVALGYLLFDSVASFLPEFFVCINRSPPQPAIANIRLKSSVGCRMEWVERVG